MTDIHTHILYNVDDGSKSIEESINLLKKLKDVGFNNVILTPHYIKGEVYDFNNEYLDKFNKLKEEININNLDINIYLGNEIFINKYLLDDIKNDNCYTLNNSNYILFEMPFHTRINNIEDWVKNVISSGCKLILAHPERYTYFQEDYRLIDNLKKEGLLFQANYGSILNYYGKDAGNLLKYMLKKGYIDYFATDIHRISDTFVIDKFKEIEDEIIKIIGNDGYDKIKNNSDDIIF